MEAGSLRMAQAAAINESNSVKLRPLERLEAHVPSQVAVGASGFNELCARTSLPSNYSPDGRIEYSLLQRFWLVARREEGSIAAALFDPTSNNATSQKRCNPPGKGRFDLRLRYLLGRGSLRIHSLARASPQAKPPLCKLYSILPSGE